MSRQCELSGKGVMTGNNVSHASDKLNQKIRFRVSAHALRSVEHVGGLDNFLIKAKDSNLSIKARKLKKRIVSA